MHGAEKKWFEAELKGNPGLKKELELRRKVNIYIDNQDAIDFRKTLMNAEARHRKATAKRKVAARQVIQYAAIFAGLILIGTISIYVLRNNSAQDNTVKYLQEYSPLTTTRAVTSSLDNAYNKATEYYKSGNYTEAIKWFNMVIDADMQVEFLKGFSHMQIKQYTEAIGSFNKVVKDNDNLFIEDATFYLGVCYVQIGQENRARQMLEGVVNSENRHKKEARKILKKIK